MDNKMKAIIGGVLGLVVVLILVFSMGSGSITPQKFAKESLVLAENVIEKIKVAETKDDVMTIYKETLPSFIDMIPGAIAGAKDYIDEKGGVEKIMEELDEGPGMSSLDKYAKDFEEVMGKAVTMQTSIASLAQDRGFEDRMEKIYESMTDLDWAEMIQFTVPLYTDMIEDIASNDDALAALNAYIALVTPEYSYEWDPETYEETKTKLDPIVLDKEKLLSLSKIIDDSFKNAKTERELEKAAIKVVEAMEKLMGRNLF